MLLLLLLQLSYYAVELKDHVLLQSIQIFSLYIVCSAGMWESVEFMEFLVSGLECMSRH